MMWVAATLALAGWAVASYVLWRNSKYRVALSEANSSIKKLAAEHNNALAVRDREINAMGVAVKLLQNELENLSPSAKREHLNSMLQAPKR